MSDHDPPFEPGAELVRKLPGFALRSERDGAAHTISPSGELDMATAPELEAELLRVEATDAHAIMLDLAALEFIDTTGIRVILKADARSRADGDRLVLLRPGARVFRVFEICGMVDRLPFAD
ncbi:MAG TPA: STAS domain-containing protein [Solirubrobacteraceae bacterium]|jgi:anti-anti-sigma factor